MRMGDRVGVQVMVMIRERYYTLVCYVRALKQSGIHVYDMGAMHTSP